MGEGSKNTVFICDWSYQHVRDAYNCNKFYVSLKVTIKKKPIVDTKDKDKEVKASSPSQHKLLLDGIRHANKLIQILKVIWKECNKLSDIIFKEP